MTDRLQLLEGRVKVVEHDIGEIKVGIAQMHVDMRENTRVTQEVANNTKDIVVAARSAGFLISLFAKVAVIAGGAAGMIYLIQLTLSGAERLS
jgi:hypothetical protein